MKVLIFILIVLGFLLVGPPLGLIFFQLQLFITVALKSGMEAATHTYTNNPRFFEILLLLSYKVGALKALISGIYVAICAIKHYRVRKWTFLGILLLPSVYVSLRYLAKGASFEHWVNPFISSAFVAVPTFLILHCFTKELLKRTQFSLSHAKKELSEDVA